MDNIDITDPNFSLSNTNFDYNNTILNYANPLWIYVGIIFFIFFAGIIFYNYYQTKKQTYNKDKLHSHDAGYNMDNTNVEI